MTAFRLPAFPLLAGCCAFLAFHASAPAAELVSDDFEQGAGDWEVHHDVAKVDPEANVNLERREDGKGKALLFQYSYAADIAVEIAAVNTGQLLEKLAPRDPEAVKVRFRARSNQPGNLRLRLWIVDAEGRSVLAYSPVNLTESWDDFEFSLASQGLGGRDKGAELSWPLETLSIQVIHEKEREPEVRPEQLWLDDLVIAED